MYAGQPGCRVGGIGLNRLVDQLPDLVFVAPAARLQLGQRKVGRRIFRVELDDRLVALFGLARLALRDVDGRQAGDRWQEYRILGERLLEAVARAGQIAACQLHPAPQVGCGGLVGLLALEVVDGPKRLVEFLPAYQRADQRQVCQGVGPGCGDGAQLRKGQLGLALGQQREGQRGLVLRVVRRQFGGLLEERLGPLDVAGQQMGFGGQVQAHRIRGGTVNIRAKHLQRLERLAPSQVGLGQQAPHRRQIRFLGQRFQQVGLRLQRRIEFELHGAGKLQQRHIGRGDAQQLLNQLSGLRRITAQESDACRQKLGLRVSRQNLAHRAQLFAGRGQVFFNQGNEDQRRVGGQVGRVQRKHLAVSRRRLGKIAAAIEPQVAQQLPCVAVGRLACQHRVDQGDRIIQAAGAGQHPGLQHQAGCMLRRGLQCRLDQGAGPLALTIRRHGRSQRRVQVGLGCRICQLQGANFRDQRLELVAQQQCLCQQGRPLFGRVVQFLGLAKLQLCSHRITGFEQRLTQQKTCFRRPGVLVQRVLQPDHGGLQITFFDRRLGLGNRSLLGRWSAPGLQGCQCDQRRNKGYRSFISLHRMLR